MVIVIAMAMANLNSLDDRAMMGLSSKYILHHAGLDFMNQQPKYEHG